MFYVSVTGVFWLVVTRLYPTHDPAPHHPSNEAEMWREEEAAAWLLTLQASN